MKHTHTQLKKTIIILIGSIIVILLIAILLVSPIAKYLIEKYDEKYTGRQIKTGLVYVNPFTGYVHIRNLKIFESKSLPDSVFFSAKGVSANFAMLQLFSNTIEITKLQLDRPKGVIIQNKRDFNFSDLIKKFAANKLHPKPSTVHFNILQFIIKDGAFHYLEKTIPVHYFIKEVNIESSGKRWNTDTVAAKFSFVSGTGSGSAKGFFTLNRKNLDYRFATIVHTYDLKFIEQYLKDLINYGNFSAFLNANIKASGNFNETENINASGMLEINDFHFGKNPKEDYASFSKFIIKIDELSPKNHKYLFDSLLLSYPYFKFEQYDHLDNLQRMFGEKGANILAAKADPSRFNLIIKIAEYVKLLAKNFFRSDYKINKLAIYHGSFQFNDYSLSEKFSIEAYPLFVIADSVNNNHQRVKVSFKSGIKPYGDMSVNLSINPKDSGDFDMQYHLQKLPVSMFNSYLITYTSYPLDRGTIELNGTWKVRNGIIKSDNHLVLLDPRITKRSKNKDTHWIPLPLIMSLIRENGNVIDYEIPITGNLKNPTFHLLDIIFDMLGNIFIKPPSTIYRAQVKNVENVIEKSLSLTWKMRQQSLSAEQKKFVDKMVDFLTDNPEATIDVYAIPFAEKEKEYIQFFEAKKKYFLANKNALSLTEDDSLKVEKMSVKDSLFVYYLNKQVRDTMLFTIQDQCNHLLGNSLVNDLFAQLNTKRKDAFMAPFKEKAVDNQVIIQVSKNNIPYNGFSIYKLVYKTEFPATLTRAYHQMEELNDEAPRKWFKNEREKLSDL